MTLYEYNFIFFFLIITLKNFRLYWVCAAARRLLKLWCMGFSWRWFLLLQCTGSRGCGAQELLRTGLVAPQHEGSFWPRDLTCVPCFCRWILNHWTTKEAPNLVFKKLFGCNLQHVGMLVPWPGIQPRPPVFEGDVLTTGPSGMSPASVFWFTSFSTYPLSSCVAI